MNTSAWTRTLAHPGVDAALVALLIGAMEVQTWTDSAIPPAHRVVTTIAVVGFVLPVTIRRWWPGPALVFSALVTAIQAPLGGNILVGMVGLLIPPVLLAFPLGTRRDASDGLLPVAGAIALLWTGIVISDHVPEPHRYGTLPASLVVGAALVALPWAAGQALRRRDRRLTEHRQLIIEAREQSAHARRVAANSERLRIGAELHDLIAQNISAIGLQATGISVLIDTDPERARQAMCQIEESGREALAELRQAVNLLRTPTPHQSRIGTPDPNGTAFAAEHRQAGQPA